MRVSYIYHSGYAVECEKCTLIFDYYKKNLPEFDKSKKLFVFASHFHKDHFNPKIFELFRDVPDVTYILSRDIHADTDPDKFGLEASEVPPAVYMRKDTEQSFDLGDGEKLLVRTLDSTDTGVAFVVECEGKTIYHAGDLNDWAWPEDTPEESADMTGRYRRELEKLRGRRIDIAFVPVDPRLGERNFTAGIDQLMEYADVQNAFPMHFWGKPSVIKRLQESAPYADRIKNAVNGPITID